MGSQEHWNLENGVEDSKELGKENSMGRTAQNLSTSLVRKKSDPMLVSKVRFRMVREFLANLQEVILGTKLCILFPAIPLAILAECYSFGRKQSDVNMLLLLLGLLCLLLPLLFRCAVQTDILEAASSILLLSRASSIMMLVAYVAYLFFQLKTHRQLFEAQEEVDESDDVLSEEKPVIGFWSAFIWLVGMTIIIALLSEYVVGTIEAASDSWGISVSFISVILLPIVGNAAEHAGSVIFAFKNKLVPLCVVVAWIMGVNMDLDFNLLETGSLAFSIIVTAFTLQDGTSHYMKGIVLCLCYTVIAACFFVHKIPLSNIATANLKFQAA
ncbi:hypothetical protein TEA_002458 [Camellia sinensis var. sinensis]|uniref:Sodium/calcium exchanger membrane region domain-containing protein n=1 Tax=Camellia sinensis var. sinensis TaxID=542762 RepID=A0A4S4DBI0_CAMSN|nr:hypothetical protein TEA_002458 [Camellia sinensis var. sinensis]